MTRKNALSTLVDSTPQLKVRLLQQKTFLTRLEKILKRSRQTPIPGHLRISNGRYYYVQETSDTDGHYLNRSQLNFASKLAQQEYRRGFLRKVQGDLKNVSKMLELLPAPVDEYYLSLCPARQQLITPYVLTDEQFRDNWLSEPFSQKEIGNALQEYVTERGEHVRSKSEKIIADKLFLLGIPYRYEAALYLRSNDPYHSDEKIHPDFTILDMNTRTEIYWEHLGMMDDPSYAANAAERLCMYQESGIYPGEGLILTFETSHHPFSGRGLEDLLLPFTK